MAKMATTLGAGFNTHTHDHRVETEVAGNQIFYLIRQNTPTLSAKYVYVGEQDGKGLPV